MPAAPLLLSGFKGLDNIARPENVAQGFLTRVENLDIDTSGHLAKRQGYTQLDGGDYLSLWGGSAGLFGVRNNQVVSLSPEFTPAVLDATHTEKADFLEVDDMVFYTSPQTSGVVVNGQRSRWGIPKTRFNLLVTSTVGTLYAGTYQVNVTLVSENGFESGCGPATIVSVAENTGITVHVPAVVDADVLKANVYCSTQDGTELFFAGSCAPGGTVSVGDTTYLVNPLRTFNFDAPPLGHLLAFYHGRIFVAEGSILWYSEPFQYASFDLSKNYLEFPSRIKAVMPVNDGIWVAADKLYFLAGESPTEFHPQVIALVDVIEGTHARCNHALIAEANAAAPEPRWFVSTNLGIYALSDQGQAENMTVKNVKLPSAEDGAAVFIQEAGINRYLSVLRQPDSAATMGDYVEAVIIRNGVPQL